MDILQFKDHHGINFTTTLHNLAEGSTKPENNKVRNDNFVVVVTGAGKGVGYHMSVSYARAGVNGLVIASRTQSDLDKLSKELKTINPSLNLLTQICDVSIPEDVEALAEATRKHYHGRLDVVVANAGIISKYLPDGALPVNGITNDDDFTRVTNINYLGTYYTARYFTPSLLSADNPSDIRGFIAITSLAGHLSDSAHIPIAYNVSKLAINRLIEHMANDHGKDGLVAYAVHPGEVLTPQTQNHSIAKGDMWETMLTTDVGLAGGFLTWLTKEKREWLSGRFLSVHWDVDELEEMRNEIVSKDKLKFRMVV